MKKGEGEKICQFEKRGTRGGGYVLKEGIRRTLIKKGVRIFKNKGGWLKRGVQGGDTD